MKITRTSQICYTFTKAREFQRQKVIKKNRSDKKKIKGQCDLNMSQTLGVFT